MLHHRLRAKQQAAAGATASFVASASSTSANITIPSSAQAGDIAVLADCAARLSGTVTNKVPSGWTLLKYLSPSNQVKFNISYRILQSGDPGSAVIGMDEAYDQKQMFVFRLSSGAVGSVNAATNEGVATSGDPAEQTIPEATAPYVACSFIVSSVLNPAWTVLTPTPDDTLYVNYLSGCYWVLNSGDEAEITIDKEDQGSHNELYGCALELS